MAGQTTADYIGHHLSFLKTGDGFWNVHLDTLFFSLVAGAIFLFFFSRVAKNATDGVPGKFQCFVEMIVEWVDGLVKDNFHGSREVVAPLFNCVLLGVRDECYRLNSCGLSTTICRVIRD